MGFLNFGGSRPHMDSALCEALGSASSVRTVVDLGCGRGKFGFLTRDRHPSSLIRGVDANLCVADYFNKSSTNPYNEIIIDDILNFLLASNERVDLIGICDVLEHFKIETVFAIMKRVRSLARQVIIVSPIQDQTSLDTYNRKADERGYPSYERHLSMLNPEIIAQEFGASPDYIQLRPTTDSCGGNAYQKFCLLMQNE